MDYTKLPKSFIYEDRKSLDDFLNNDLNKALVRNMQDIDILLDSDFEAHALKCMNAAYYICTIIMLEKHPVWRLSSFDSYLCHLNIHPVVKYKEIVFSLVYIMLKRYNKTWQNAHSDLINKLFLLIYPEEKNQRVHVRIYMERAPRDILGTLENHLPAVILPDDEFACRQIDPVSIKWIDYEWASMTDNFSKEKVKEVVELLASNNEARIYLIEKLVLFVEERCKYEKFVRDGILNGLNELMKAYGGVSVEENDHYHADATLSLAPIMELKAELNKANQRIKELEAENERLKPESAQQAAPDEASKVEELCVQLLAAQDRIKELENENCKLSEFKKTMEELSNMSAEGKLAIDERIIFFSSAVGLDFDPKRTNQTQLAKLISELSGDAPTSIRGRISKMNQMEKNSNFTDEVMQAARNVKGMLEKVPQGNQPQKLKDIIENIEAVFLN